MNRLGQAGEKEKKEKKKRKNEEKKISDSQPEQEPGHPLQIFDS